MGKVINMRKNSNCQVNDNNNYKGEQCCSLQEKKEEAKVRNWKKNSIKNRTRNIKWKRIIQTVKPLQLLNSFLNSFPKIFSVHSLCPGLIDSLSRIRRLFIPTTIEKYCINIIIFALANIIVQWCKTHY